MKIEYEYFGTNLRSARLRRKISQSAFAELSGFSQSQVSDFETGRRLPTLKNLYRLRDALSCKWGELLDKPKTKKNK